MIEKPFKDAMGQLPVGVLLPSTEPDNGLENVREYELGPITGRIRLALGRKDLQRNPGKRNTKMLSLLLKRLGPLEGPISEGIVRSMTFADREFLLWETQLDRANSDEVEIETTCTECGAQTLIDVHRDELMVNVLEDGDAEIIDGRRTFQFDHPKHGTLVAQMSTGKDEEAVAPLYVNNPQEAELRELYGAVHSYQGGPITWDEFLDLSSDVLEWISEAMGSIDIGATQRIQLKCRSCDETYVEVVTPFDFSEMSSDNRTPVRAPYETRSSG